VSWNDLHSRTRSLEQVIYRNKIPHSFFKTENRNYEMLEKSERVCANRWLKKPPNPAHIGKGLQNKPVSSKRMGSVVQEAAINGQSNGGEASSAAGEQKEN